MLDTVMLDCRFGKCWWLCVHVLWTLSRQLTDGKRLWPCLVWTQPYVVCSSQPCFSWIFKDFSGLFSSLNLSILRPLLMKSCMLQPCKGAGIIHSKAFEDRVFSIAAPRRWMLCQDLSLIADLLVLKKKVLQHICLNLLSIRRNLFSCIFVM